MLQHRRETYAAPVELSGSVETVDASAQTAPIQLPAHAGGGGHPGGCRRSICASSIAYTDEMPASGVYTGPLLGAQPDDVETRLAAGIDGVARPPELSLDERVLTLDVGSRSSTRTKNVTMSGGGKSAERRRHEGGAGDPASARLRAS